MSRIVFILFTVGLLLNVLKGAELILRPHQQKYLQDKMESLTLKLDYTRPLEWYKNLSGSIWRSIFITVCLLTMLTINIFQLLSMPNPKSELIGAGIIMGIIGIVFAARFSIRATEFLLDEMGYLSLVGKLCIVVLTSAVAFCFFLLLFLGLRILNLMLAESAIGTILFFTAGLIVLLIITIISSILTYLIILGFFLLITALIFLILESLLKLFRAFAWRLVEYNKGAWAAIVLVLTLVLGVMDLFFRFQ